MPPPDASRRLARRLKDLRTNGWPGVSITQADLAAALSARKPASVPLISSWETARGAVPPPRGRLAAYATFFATPRSVERRPFRLLDERELTAEELRSRDKLAAELLGLRAAAVGDRPGPSDASSNAAAADVQRRDDPWRFADRHVITIVCGLLPSGLGGRLTDPADPNYTELYTYADTDALLEAHGHIRAVNPESLVVIRTAVSLEPDDYTTHLVLLGNGEGNPTTSDVMSRAGIPFKQLPPRPGERGGRFETDAGLEHAPSFKPADLAAMHFAAADTHKQGDDVGILTDDPAIFVRTVNPYHRRRRLTICSGIHGRGTLGAVRALTDARFRDGNAEFVRSTFAEARNYGVLMNVTVLDGKVVTPDWTQQETVLDLWPRPREVTSAG